MAEVTVIGVPDAYRGEAPKAFVKLKEGHELTAEALLEYLVDQAVADGNPRRGRVPGHPAQDADRQAVEKGAEGGVSPPPGAVSILCCLLLLLALLLVLRDPRPDLRATKEREAALDFH